MKKDDEAPLVDPNGLPSRVDDINQSREEGGGEKEEGSPVIMPT